MLIDPTGASTIILEIVTNCPHYIEGKTKVWDIRDPVVKELCGVDVSGGNISLEVDCPYHKKNPEFWKPKPKGEKPPRLHVWGYSRSRRRRQRSNVARATSGSLGDGTTADKKLHDRKMFLKRPL